MGRRRVAKIPVGLESASPYKVVPSERSLIMIGQRWKLSWSTLPPLYPTEDDTDPFTKDISLGSTGSRWLGRIYRMMLWGLLKVVLWPGWSRLHTSIDILGYLSICLIRPEVWLTSASGYEWRSEFRVQSSEFRVQRLNSIRFPHLSKETKTSPKSWDTDMIVILVRSVSSVS